MNDMALEIDPRNAGVLREWDGEHGTYWAEHAATYNASIARYQSGLIAAIGAQPGERILDVGCGSGGLAIDLVRGTPGTTALGVDLSTAQLEVARQQAGELPVTFAQADAQVHDFGAHSFDVIASRTGTMFFTDMAMAFANLAKATRPGGRLVMLVWRGIEDNEWLREFFGAIGRVLPMAPPPADAPGPFSLSDPDRVRDLLHAAGWADVAFAAADELLWFGPRPGLCDHVHGRPDEVAVRQARRRRQAAGRGEPARGHGRTCRRGRRAPRVRCLDRHRATLMMPRRRLAPRGK